MIRGGGVGGGGGGGAMQCAMWLKVDMYEDMPWSLIILTPSLFFILIFLL